MSNFPRDSDNTARNNDTLPPEDNVRPVVSCFDSSKLKVPLPLFLPLLTHNCAFPSALGGTCLICVSQAGDRTRGRARLPPKISSRNLCVSIVFHLIFRFPFASYLLFVARSAPAQRKHQDWPIVIMRYAPSHDAHCGRRTFTSGANMLAPARECAGVCMTIRN